MSLENEIIGVDHLGILTGDLKRDVAWYEEKLGFEKIQRCSLLLDKPLTHFNPKQDQIIHPIGFLKGPIQSGSRR